MKRESSDNLLKPDLMFRVVSGHPPADIETVAELQEWRRAEDEKVVAECMRLFREQLDAAFAQFQRDMNDDDQIAHEMITSTPVRLFRTRCPYAVIARTRPLHRSQPRRCCCAPEYPYDQYPRARST